MKNPNKTIKTKLKFSLSEKNPGSYIGFVSINTSDGRVMGVRENDKLPKKVCVISNTVDTVIEQGILYDVELIPMKNAQAGFIVVKAEPHEFTAKVVTSIIPKIEYKATCTFGNKKIMFDPFEGRRASMNTIEGAVGELLHRKDIKNLASVIEDFRAAAYEVYDRFKADGCDIIKLRRNA